MRKEDGPREGETTYYADGWGEPEAVHSDMLITSVRFKTEYKHDHIDIWNRGGGSGHLVVKAGDAPAIAKRLLQDTNELAEIKKQLGEWAAMTSDAELADRLRRLI